MKMLTLTKEHCNKQSVIFSEDEISFSINAYPWGQIQFEQVNGLSDST